MTTKRSLELNCLERDWFKVLNRGRVDFFPYRVYVFICKDNENVYIQRLSERNDRDVLTGGKPTAFEWTVVDNVRNKQVIDATIICDG